MGFRSGLWCITLGLWVSCLPAAGQGQQSYLLTDGRSLAPLDVFRECDACPEMIVMPPGSFMMGAKPGDSRNPIDMFGPNATFRLLPPGKEPFIPGEHPRHRVEMDIPFAMGRNEVTHAEWMACVDAGACTRVPKHVTPTLSRDIPLGPKHPVINISYLDMQEYVLWLNTLVGAKVYRLPTEAEWEYAARAGTETRFAQGDELTSDQANFNGEGEDRMRGNAVPMFAWRDTPVEVDALDAANGWGLRHMSGNVSERTLSCWAEGGHLGLASDSAYLANALSQQECNRVERGGAFTHGMDYARPAARGGAIETYRRYMAGFRLIRQF